MLVLADVPLEGEDAQALLKWVEKGGMLVRFAGPRMAEASTDPSHDDPLLPVPLLAGDRQLGGALSWSQPAGLAPFPPNSPFAGLHVPAEVKVSRQVLAEPSADLAAHTWASLADGTPLVTAATRGAGRVVLFGVTANADWSDLPLSGLFVDMLRRLVDLSAGVAATGEEAALPPAETLDGFGALVAAAAGRDRDLRQGAGAAGGLAAPSAGHLRTAKRAADAEPRRGPAAAAGRADRARGGPAGADRRPAANGRSARHCSASRSRCWPSTC